MTFGLKNPFQPQSDTEMSHRVFKAGLISLWVVLIVSLSGALMSCKSTQPKTAEEHLSIAQAYIKEGNFGQAYFHLSKALDLDPNDPDVHENLSWLYLFTDRLPEARTELEALKKLRPDGASTEYLSGAILAHMDKHRNALQYFQKARKAGYDLPNIYYDMGQSLMSINQDDKALLAFNQGLSRVPEADTSTQVNFLFAICVANYHLEHLKEAENYCQLALEITPDDEEKQNINNILHNIELLQMMKTEPEGDIDVSDYILEGHDPSLETALEGGVPEREQSTEPENH